jgi:hypothetical protein
LDSRCWTNDRNDTALNAIAFIRLQGRMLCESNVGVDLITNGRLFPLFHPTRIISQGNWGRKFLVPVWQLHDIVPITSRVAPEEPATTRRPTIWTAAAARRLQRRRDPIAGRMELNGPTSGRRGNLRPANAGG